MGYSSAAKASLTLDAIGEILDENKLRGETSNGLPHGGFYEIGRENDDGAITGTVWKPYDNIGHVVRQGGFRIEPDGKVKRFPSLKRKLLSLAETRGAVKFSEMFERNYGNPGGVTFTLI